MTLDERLLAGVEEARLRLERLEGEVFDARRAFHASIRRLHEAGGSMREIATALAMSHQRVHQIVGDGEVVEVEATSTDVTPHPAAPAEQVEASTRVAMRRRASMRCSFCNASQTQVTKLIAGPEGTFVCGSCVAAARGVASTGDATPGPQGLRPAERESHPCSFCGRTQPAVTTIVKGARARICDDCLALCEEILAEVG